MAVPGLYIPIRGDYSDFQKDLARLRGIAREEGTRISEALQMAISPKDAVVGLTKIGAELKKLTAAAQSTGRTLNAPVEQLTEFAQKANVAASVVEELHYEMLKTARDRQLESALRSLQKQCGLTEDAVARLQAHMGDTAGSIDTAMKALGVRSAQAIKKEMASLEASFDHAIKHGNLTIKEQERLVDALEKKWAALNAEMGVMPVKHPFFAAKETLGVRETGDVMAEARQARQAYETIQQSAWKTREMSVASHDAMVASLKKLAQELRLTASETSKFIAAFAGSRDALDSAMGSAGLRSTRAIRQEIAEVNRLLHRVESSASATLEDKERMRAWAVNRTDALTREMRMPGQLTANERYEQATGLLGMKTDAQYRQQAKGIVQAYLEVKTSARSSAEDVQRAHARMIESFRRLREEMNSWRPQAQTVDPSKVLGVRTNREIYADIAALQQAFMQFSLAPGRAADEVERAKARMQAAIRELHREMGVVSAQDRRDGFLRLLGIRSVADIENDKQALINAHRQIVNEFQRGVGGWSEQDLRNSLAARNAGLQRLAQEAGTWQEPARTQINPLRQRYDTLASQVGRTNVSFGQYEGFQKAKEAISAFQDLNGRLPRPREIREIAAATGLAADQLRRMRDAADHSSSAFKALIGYAQVWLTFGFAHTAVDFVKTAMALENVKVAFQAIYGTADMAQAKLDYVRQVSEQLGLSFIDTAEGAKKLFAAAAGTPVEKEANMVFKAFSDMSAAMKLTGDETKGVFLALSQMISKGKVSAEELRQQLAERMPGAVNLFARSIGKTTQELDKMLQQGGVTLEHFLMFAREVQNTYGAGAIAAGGSLQAELNRLKNAWVDFKAGLTDTDTLSSAVRGITSAFKALAPVFELIAKYSNEIVTVGLAAWIGSSFAAGGKLNGVMTSLQGTFQKANHRISLFNTLSATMAARANGASVAVGRLAVGIRAIGSGALIGGAVALVALLGEMAYSAAQAARGFQNARKSMSEYVADAAKLKNASDASNFTPELMRKSLDEDTKKHYSEWDTEYQKLGEQVQSKYTTSHLATDRMFGQEDVSKKASEHAYKVLGEYQKAFRKAIESGNVDLAAEIKTKMTDAWVNGLGETVGKIGGVLGVDFNKAFGSTMEQMSQVLSNTSKKLQTFSSDSADASKRLGLNAAQMAEDFKKMQQAAEKTELGKAFISLQKIEDLKKTLNDTSIEFSKEAAASADYAAKVKSLGDSLGDASNKFNEHKAYLESYGEAFRHGAITLDEFQAKQKEVAGEGDELKRRQDELANSITTMAMAAGGTDASFNIMIAAFQQSKIAGQMTEEAIQAVINKVRELQGEAQNAMIQAQSALNVMNINRQTRLNELGVKVRIARKKGDVDALTEAYAGQERTKLDRDITEKEREALRHRAESDIKGDKLWESFSKGGKGGGGGSKRVDNTAEKYQSSLEGFRKEIAKLRGETDKVTLDKKFADMDKQLKGSTADIKALKKEYYEAFNVHSLHEFEKTMFQLVGNEKALADIDIEEKLKAQQAQFDGMNKAAQELGLATVDYTAKMEAYRKALQNNSNEQWLEKQIPVYQEIAIYEKDKTKVLELQNQLIDIQAEKMANTFPPEVVERWREVQRLQNATDAFSGIKRGFNSIAKDSMNAAQFMENTMTQTYDILSEGFTNFVTKGKVDMQDLLNSWINMVNQMVMKAAMSKVFDLIGGLFNGIGGVAGSVSGVAGKVAGAASSLSSGVAGAAAGVKLVAKGGAFSGLHGWSNQIVDRPTLFSYGSQITKFAKGGVMGEAGPEAIMPLTRTASGHLGVRTDGAASPQSMAVTLVISDQTEGGVKADATGGELDGKQIAVIVKQVENAMVARSLNGKSQYTKYLDRTRGLSNAKQLY